ncbi:MAG TPA: hypothetical protein VNF06_00875 [Candidatus Aquilonibacter sp.]|nr:hypothetical protein [Candidatus Aquilonibacter sp.]
MANKSIPNSANITKTTTTRNTTRTTTIRNASPRSKPERVQRRKSAKAPTAKIIKKSGNGKYIAAVIIILVLLAAAAYLLLNPSLTPAQQRSQFVNQLNTLQNNIKNLSLFYIANAGNYQLPLNHSWSIQVTDQNPGNSTPIGQLTISWSAVSRNFSIQNGIVNTGISPTYAITLSHSDFMAFSQTVITRNTAVALGYYSSYYISGKLKYTQIN